MSGADERGELVTVIPCQIGLDRWERTRDNWRSRGFSVRVYDRILRAEREEIHFKVLVVRRKP